MTLIAALFSEKPVFVIPDNFISWMGIFLYLLVIILLIRTYRKDKTNTSDRYWFILGSLIFITPLTSLLLGLRLPNINVYPSVDSVFVTQGPALMLLSSVPWVFAAGLLGPIPAALLGAIVGLYLAVWDTHFAYTALEFALLGTIYSGAIRQPYNTRFFNALRRPLFASLLLSLVYPIIFTIGIIIGKNGSMPERLDFLVSQIVVSSLAVGGSLIVAGLLAELFIRVFPNSWEIIKPHSPSPAQKSLETRFIYNIAPFIFFLIVALIIGDWVVAGNAAREMLASRMTNATRVAAESIPQFLDNGKGVINYLSNDPRLDLESAQDLTSVLEYFHQSTLFFNQFLVFDNTGKLIAGYPVEDSTVLDIDVEEEKAVLDALAGVLAHVYSIEPLDNSSQARVSFIATTMNSSGTTSGVLIGRTELGVNPFTFPMIEGLKSISSMGGDGVLVDGDGSILFHTDPTHLMDNYAGKITDSIRFYQDISPDGTRQFVSSQLAVGGDWGVVVTIPTHRAQEIALTIATPLVGIILILSIAGILVIYSRLRSVTSSLRALAIESERISLGELNHEMLTEGDDEVAQLRRAFEQMRISLRARLQELNSLLVVSQGVASSLKIDDAVKPILDSALTLGAVSARIILDRSVQPISGSGYKTQSSFGAGEAHGQYKYIDEQILDITSKKDLLVVTNPARTPLLKFQPDENPPEGLLAIALRHEGNYYGSLWVVYDEIHPFPEEEVRFMTNLASQAVIAAVNAELYLSAEIGRERLVSILDSTPDPVIVVDHNGVITLINQSALDAVDLVHEQSIGILFKETITDIELLNLLSEFSQEKKSKEITLKNGNAYFATVAPIGAIDGSLDYLCFMHDITKYKKLDITRSDYVTIVSHDLRTQITNIQGQTRMLTVLGELNSEQNEFLEKIDAEMTDIIQMVNDILDLERISTDPDLIFDSQPIDELLSDVVAGLTSNTELYNVKIEIESSIESGAKVEVQKVLMHKALHDLVKNAIQNSSRGTVVWLRSRLEGRTVVFEVEDTGNGIAPIDQTRIFDLTYNRMVQEDDQPTERSFGLAIVKSIAEHHNGRVWLDSELGQGTIFYLEIPQLQDDNPF